MHLFFLFLAFLQETSGKFKLSPPLSKSLTRKNKRFFLNYCRLRGGPATEEITYGWYPPATNVWKTLGAQSPYGTRLSNSLIIQTLDKTAKYATFV